MLIPAPTGWYVHRLFCQSSSFRTCIIIIIIRQSAFIKIPPLLKHSQALCASMAAVTYSDWVVPAPGGNRPDVAGAGTTHTLSTGPAVVLRHGCCKDFRALVALGDVLVWYPVVWPGCILHKT